MEIEVKRVVRFLFSLKHNIHTTLTCYIFSQYVTLDHCILFQLYKQHILDMD